MTDKKQLNEGMEKRGGVNSTPITPKQEIKPPAQKPVQPEQPKATKTN